MSVLSELQAIRQELSEVRKMQITHNEQINGEQGLVQQFKGVKRGFWAIAGTFLTFGLAILSQLIQLG